VLNSCNSSSSSSTEDNVFFIGPYEDPNLMETLGKQKESSSVNSQEDVDMTCSTISTTTSGLALLKSSHNLIQIKIEV
jgi:hypothetical protein